MDSYDKRYNDIAQKEVVQRLDAEKKREIVAEIRRIESEMQKLQEQRLELKKVIENDKNYKFQMNLNLGFIPKSNTLK
jgi:hypothetical protein